MSVDRISREISRIMASKPKKPQPYDTIGVVQGVRDGKAWVRFAGSDQETPVQMTIDAKEGDSVMVRVAGGRAFIIGNDTAPPTDDRAANEAHKAANIAYNRAVQASEEVAETNVKVAENAEQMAQTVIQINSDIEGLQEQIDGNITSWFYAVDPTLNNPPASDWREEGSESVHLGDLYYNTDTGYAWRWMYDGDEDEYGWMRITDVDVVKALADAAKAQDTADSKRRVFVAQPTPPYDIGDLWVQGSTGDILRSTAKRETGASYVAADWIKASKYTDDTVAQQALTSANGKNTIYHSATAPSGGTYKTGDTWFDTSNGYAINTWNGSQWVKEELGEDAIADLSITNAKIANGTIQSAKIGAVDVGKLTGGYIDASHINASVLTIGQNQVTGLTDDLAGKANTGDIPTNVSDLTNDSGFQTASQVETTVTGKGYQTSAQVESAITSKGYQTASQVNTAVNNGVSGKADKTDAILEQQRIYKSVASGGSASATTTWVSETGDVQNTWTTKRPTYSSSYPVLYTAIQRKKVSGTISCTTPLKDDTLTVIDGGHITTGTIDAARINVSQINVGDLHDDGTYLTEADQLTVDSIEYAYQLSTSGTSVPQGTWQTTPQAPTATQFAWTRTTTNYSDGTSAVTYTVGGKQGIQGIQGQQGIQGEQGETGDDGTTFTPSVDANGNISWTNDGGKTNPTTRNITGPQGEGVTITSTTTRYQSGTSPSSAPTGSWLTSPPTVSAGKYLWTRVIVNYSDGTSTTSYSVARQGENGTDVTSQYVTYIDSINGVRIMNAANSSNYSQIIAGAFDIYQSGVNISHQGYDNGNNSAGGSSKAPYYTFGTRASDTSTTRGNYSFAEGYSVTASGYCSHAEGYKATASGSHSHAEGSETEAASGTYVGAHAEGWHTKATATAAHAEGAYTEANASESHAGGFHTIAGYSYQTAIGQYNDNQEDNVFEIGWGTSSSRKNMFAVDKYGNALHYGDGVFDITSSITNVTTGTKVSAKVAKFGAVVSFHLTFTNTSSVASGSNVFAAKLNASKYRPLLDWATGGGYYGGASLNLAIDSSGNITVRNCGSSAITCRQNSNVVATYIVDGSTGL